MSKARTVVRVRRPSRKQIHVGRATVFPRGTSWYIYYRENGAARRISIGPDRKEAERRAAEVNAQLAHGAPSACGSEKVAVKELVRLWVEHHEPARRSSVEAVRRYRAAADHLLRFIRERHPGLAADARARSSRRCG